MTTEAQIAANRANAQHSTGPKTLKGKLRAARNALKHGLRAKVILDQDEWNPGEAPGPLAELIPDLVAELRPVGVLEQSCVETIALCLYRQRRVVRHELYLIDYNRWEDDMKEYNNPTLRPGVSPNDPKLPTPPLYPALPATESLLPLIRYEAHLDRQYHRALQLLRELQATRLAQDPDAQLPPESPAEETVSPPASDPSPTNTEMPNKPDSASSSHPVYPVHPCSSAPVSDPPCSCPAHTRLQKLPNKANLALSITRSFDDLCRLASQCYR